MAIPEIECNYNSSDNDFGIISISERKFGLSISTLGLIGGQAARHWQTDG